MRAAPIAAFAAALCLLSPAAGHEAPPGWQVTLRAEPLLPKQQIYRFTLRVRDGQGRPVEGARVFLHIPEAGRRHRNGSLPGRQVAAREAGGGCYTAVTALRPLAESLRHVRAVMRPPGSDPALEGRP